MSSTTPPGLHTPDSAPGDSFPAKPAVESDTGSQRNTDWADQVTDLFVDLVDNVRDKTTGPILKVARGVVYGIVAFVVLVFVAIAGLILLGRIAFLIPVEEWIVYLGFGVIFSALGFFLWSKRQVST